MGAYVPRDISKILYLDCDLVCRGSLLPLYSEETGDDIVLGVDDVLSKDNTVRLSLGKYISAGVMLINLDAWRKEDCCGKLLKYVELNCGNSERLKYHDQDAINAVLNDRIRMVDSKWNAQTSSYLGSEKQNFIGKTAIIVHFVSDRKPWVEGAESPFAYEYFHYLGLSPW